MTHTVLRTGPTVPGGAARLGLQLGLAGVLLTLLACGQPGTRTSSSGDLLTAQQLADELLLNAPELPGAGAGPLSGPVVQGLSLSSPALLPLGAVPVPRPPRSDIKNLAAAIRLGKTLFWDAQLGSDGKTACASCHARAGTDNRMTNTINPGPDSQWQAVSGPGQRFTFHLSESGDGSDFLPPGGDDIVGSQGVARLIFTGLHPDPSVGADLCTADPGTLFGVHRQVTGRNSPSTIAAVFNRQQFWDGRANDIFNGLNPFGKTANAQAPTRPSSDASGFRADGDLSNIDLGVIESLLTNASLASQAVGPVNNDVEMACAGRKMNGKNGVAAKLLARQPLRGQQVSPQDSVLGALASPTGGLRVTYKQLVSAAFVDAAALRSQDRFTNILGQAIQAYESTLIPSQTSFDAYLAGNSAAMTPQQVQGLEVFRGRGHCLACHAGSELTDASPRYFALNGARNSDGGDQGFHNIGVRPTADDLGRAGVGPGGVSFSESASPFDRGAFKTPSLRNLKLTAPYFHTGSAATVHDVIDFYEQHGTFSNPEKSGEMQSVQLETADHPALEDFLLNALLDCRVATSSAPFDHPALPLPNGEPLTAVGAGGQGSCP